MCAYVMIEVREQSYVSFLKFLLPFVWHFVSKTHTHICVYICVYIYECFEISYSSITQLFPAPPTSFPTQFCQGRFVLPKYSWSSGLQLSATLLEQILKQTDPSSSSWQLPIASSARGETLCSSLSFCWDLAWLGFVQVLHILSQSLWVHACSCLACPEDSLLLPSLALLESSSLQWPLNLWRRVCVYTPLILCALLSFYKDINCVGFSFCFYPVWVCLTLTVSAKTLFLMRSHS